MKVLLQLRVEDPARKHRAAALKKVARKRAPSKARGEDEESKLPTPAAVKAARRLWVHYWLDIGEVEVADNEWADLSFLPRVPGLMMGDFVRCIPLRSPSDNGTFKYADVTPAVSVSQVSEERADMFQTADYDIFDDDDEGDYDYDSI